MNTRTINKELKQAVEISGKNRNYYHETGYKYGEQIEEGANQIYTECYYGILTKEHLQNSLRHYKAVKEYGKPVIDMHGNVIEKYNNYNEGRIRALECVIEKMNFFEEHPEYI